MRALAILALLIATPATAQLTNPTSGGTTPDQVAAAIAAAALPACPAPRADQIVATAGTGSMCAPRTDAAGPSVVMPATAVTASDGSFAANWPGTFPTAPTTAMASAKTTANPYICQVSSATTTGFAGKCWQIISNTLPGAATALLNLVLSSYVPAAGGLTVMVVGRQ